MASADRGRRRSITSPPWRWVIGAYLWTQTTGSDLHVDGEGRRRSDGGWSGGGSRSCLCQEPARIWRDRPLLIVLDGLRRCRCDTGESPVSMETGRTHVLLGPRAETPEGSVLCKFSPVSNCLLWSLEVFYLLMNVLPVLVFRRVLGIFQSGSVLLFILTL